MHMRIGMAPSAGVLMGCFAVSLGALAPPALAQVTDTPRASHRPQRVRVAVPAQDLTRALANLSQQTGVPIRHAGDLPAITANAVNGTLSLDQALATLLAGSGLVWRFTGDGVVVERGAEDVHRLEEVQVADQSPVTEYAWGAASKGYLATHSTPLCASSSPVESNPVPITRIRFGLPNSVWSTFFSHRHMSGGRGRCLLYRGRKTSTSHRLHINGLRPGR